MSMGADRAADPNTSRRGSPARGLAERRLSASDHLVQAPRRSKRLLLSGVCLASLLALAIVPSVAAAADECGPATGSSVVCTSAGNPYPNGITYSPVADLTVVTNPDVVVTGPLLVTNGASVGAIIITHNGAIATTGEFSSGIYAIGGSGAVTVNSNSVSTTGDFGNGIAAASTSGAVTVSSNSVSTTGRFSFGISAYSQTGAVVVTSGTISVASHQGYGLGASTGLGSAYLGPPIVVTSGSVSTGGGTGIGVFGSGSVTVTSGTVTTGGGLSGGSYEGTGISARGGSGVTSVTSTGAITTTERSGSGIFARSGFGNTIVVNSGTITVGADGIDATAPMGTVSVSNTAVITTAGRTSTYGFNRFAATARGIYAQASGDVTVSGSGSIFTTGYRSPGVQAFSDVGNVTVQSGSVSTIGRYSLGIAAYTRGGTATVSSGSVQTVGDQAIGIYAAGMGAVSVTSGTVTTQGASSRGILAYSTSGPVSVTSGSITTSGAYANGIIADAPSIMVNSGSITTSGVVATGIRVFGTGPSGDVGVLTTGTIDVSGATANGIHASNNYGALSVTNTGSIINSASQGHGIYADGSGAVTVSGSGSVSTSGAYAPAILATSTGGLVSVSQGSVSASGAFSDGILAQGASVVVDSNAVSTTGRGANAVLAQGSSGPVTVTSAGPVSTSGSSSPGVFGFSFMGDVSVSNTGSITTTGSESRALGARALGGASSATNAGIITTSGAYSFGLTSVGGAGVTATNTGLITTSGYRATGIGTNTVGLTSGVTGAITDSNSGTVTTSGIGANGIAATNAYGPVSVTNTGAIVTSGDQSLGVLVRGFGGATVASSGSITVAGQQTTGILAHSTSAPVTVSSGSTIATGLGSVAIDASSGGPVSVTSGTTSSSLGIAILAQSTGDAASVSVTGPTTSGSTSAIELKAVTTAALTVGPAASVSGFLGGAYISSGAGSTLTNAGTIGSQIGLAIQSDGAAIMVNNTGAVQGSVSFSGSGSVFNNSGAFISAHDSSFGTAGVFNNAGRVGIAAPNAAAAASHPLNVAFAGLQSFNNNGSVDLRNGVAGDVLTIPGAFNGGATSLLALDVQPGGGAADRLVVGSATGTTSLLIDTLGSGPGVLNKGVVVVQVGSGASPTAFKLANGPITRGFVHYVLSYDAAAGAFDLIGLPDAQAYQPQKFVEGAQNLWQETAQAWSDHLSDLRDGHWGGDRSALSAGGHSWGQVFGASLQRQTAPSFSALGQTQDVNLSYNQDFIGFETGFDLVHPLRAGTLVSGLTGGFATSRLKFKGGADGADYAAANIGGYVAYLLGPMFVNALLKYDHFTVSASSVAAQYGQSFDGNGYGGTIEAGYRFGTQRFYLEPVASVAYLRTHLDSFVAQASTFDFSEAKSLRAKIGLRAGTSLDIGGGSRLAPYVAVHAVKEFEGRNSVDFSNGGYSLAFVDQRPPTRGEGAVGVNVISLAGLTGFIEGDADFGGGSAGGGGKFGVRLKW